MSFEYAAATGPMSVGLNTMPDATIWLAANAPNACERLRQLRQRSHDLHSLIPPFDERNAATTARVEAEQRLTRLQAHTSAGGFGLAATDERVVHARKQVEKLTDDLARLTKLDATRSAAWTAASQTLRACEDWLKGDKPSGVVLEDFDEPAPTLNKGENITDAIERVRHRGRELKADLHRIRSAPYPSSHAKAQTRQQIEKWAQAVNVSRLVEADGDIAFPTMLLRSEVHAAERPAVAFAEVPDVIALTCWLHKDALIAALDREIDAESDDKSALSHAEREKRESVVLGDLLPVERDEAALTFKAWAEGLPVEPRADISPVAMLGVQLVTAARVNPSQETSPGHVLMRR